jgi:hypothetical protein
VAGRAGVILGGMLTAAGLAELLLLTNLSGLWLVLLGLFLMAAARAETADATQKASLGRLRVGEVMTGPPVCGYAIQSVANFVATVARHHPYRAFPVLDLDGRVAGLVSLPDWPAYRRAAVTRSASAMYRYARPGARAGSRAVACRGRPDTARRRASLAW